MTGGTVFLLALIALFFYIYWLPSLIAARRQHPDRHAIFALNLFFGATLVGWVIALIWAKRGIPVDVRYR
jgi:hypothetical protein